MWKPYEPHVKARRVLKAYIGEDAILRREWMYNALLHAEMFNAMYFVAGWLDVLGMTPTMEEDP
jgi:hypothetical protein